MARKPITREDINPSYDDVIKELLNVNSMLWMENTVMKLTIQKLEGILAEISQGSYEPSREENKEF